MTIKKAVIPAAGFGTRMLPATKVQPKEMLPVVDQPVIQYVVEEAIASKIEDILVITGRGKRALEDHFDRSIELERHLQSKKDHHNLEKIREISNGLSTFFIRQKEQRGLGHAVLCAEKHVADEPFAVMLGDDICVSDPPALEQLISLYNENPGIVIGLEEVKPDKVDSYGIVKPSSIDGRVVELEDLVEKPSVKEAPSNLAIMGRYILTPDIFEALKNTAPDHKGEIQLTNAIRQLIGKVPIYGYIMDTQRFDVGNKLSYLTTNIEMALMRADLREDLSKYLIDLSAKLKNQNTKE